VLASLTADSRIDDSPFGFGLRSLLDGYAVRITRTMAR
jgi:hypothetical protein